MQHYSIIRNWTSSVANGADDTKIYRNEFGRNIVVQTVAFAAFTAAAISNVLAGTPFVRDMPKVDLAFPSLGKLTILVEINGNRISTDPWNALLHTGTGENPHYPMTQIVIPGGAECSFKLANASGVACTATLVLGGYIE